MIDFSRSFLTWTHHPHKPDPVYKYTGGLLADPGDVICVRLKADARLTISPDKGEPFTCFVIAPCRAEYTIVSDNLFQIPSGEYRAVFSETLGIPIGRQPSDEAENLSRQLLAESYARFDVDIRHFGHAEPLTSVPAVIEATRANSLMNATCSYRDVSRQLTVTLEFPVELINFDEGNATFQVCTEPVILPDLATWDGNGLDRVFLAGVAFSDFEHVEFILRREIEPAASELSWYHEVRGRDRNEVREGAVEPPDTTRGRPKPLVFNEVWTRDAEVMIARVSGGR